VIQMSKLEAGFVRAKPTCRQTIWCLLHGKINQQSNQISTGGAREQQQISSFKQQRICKEFILSRLDKKSTAFVSPQC
jgi:hypothetical protein